MAKSKFEKLLENYDYDLPESFIAQTPANPRDSAKLLVYDKNTQKTEIDIYKNLPKYLPSNSILVFNQTKVIPARLHVTKPTGGKVELLFLEKDDNTIKVLANTKLTPGMKLVLNHTIFFNVLEKQDAQYKLQPSFDISKLFEVLEAYGTTPIPPYIKHNSQTESKLRKEYQTVFAKEKGSVAAPTASLHFTNELLDRIRKAGHEIVFVTLHVNLGTFAKLTEEHVETLKLHEEYFEISKKAAETLNSARKNKKSIIPVGTTVTRTLESAVNSNGIIEKLSGTTDLFITEEYKLKFVNSVITNFHVPKSSLLMLISAFIGRKKLFELYEIAKKNNFRFFSFGDGMFIK